MPRATTAACDVAPPLHVSTPFAAIMPCTSSGAVSLRTRITALPCLSPRGRGVGVEDDLPRGGARRCVEPGARFAYVTIGIDARKEQRFELARLDAHDRLFFA